MKELDLDDVAATSPKAKAELEELRAELAKVNNEFGCETADWPDAWRRVAAVKQEAGKWFRESEELRAENERLKEQLKTCATILTGELIRGRLIGVPQKLSFSAEREMKNLDEVTEWMITTRRNFETPAREFSAMNVKVATLAATCEKPDTNLRDGCEVDDLYEDAQSHGRPGAR
ncbi:MAG: hypothetical protein BWZ07_02906 [Alphaproteobacteria bacterium ADurb.BinA280]|nr:MAG: hypothetical protein BWZ07_02906 [Alphaproteobacteria bacterium ADurb.BinA280]